MKNANRQPRPFITIRDDKEPSIWAIIGACAVGALFAIVVFHAL